MDYKKKLNENFYLLEVKFLAEENCEEIIHEIIPQWHLQPHSLQEMCPCLR